MGILARYLGTNNPGSLFRLPLLIRQLRPNEKLQVFDGALDISLQTYNHIKFDLSIRASRKGRPNRRGALLGVVAKYVEAPNSYEALGACPSFHYKYEVVSHTGVPDSKANTQPLPHPGCNKR